MTPSNNTNCIQEIQTLKANTYKIIPFLRCDTGKCFDIFISAGLRLEKKVQSPCSFNFQSNLYFTSRLFSILIKQHLHAFHLFLGKGMCTLPLRVNTANTCCLLKKSNALFSRSCRPR